MTSPTSATPVTMGSTVRPSPLVARTFGEPRFHTDGDVAAVAFAADGTLYSVDEAGVLRHWAADGHPLSRSYLSDLETLWCFAPGATALASGNDDLLFWDPVAGRLADRVSQPAWVTALGYSADGAALASGHDDGRVRLWNAAARTVTAEISAHKSAVSAVSFAPAGDRLATAGEDRVVRVWDVATGKKLAELASHTDRIPALAWHPNGALLISAGWDTSARVWDVSRPDPLMLLNSHADQVLAVAYSPTAAVLASADSDNDIHLWSDPSAGTVARVLRGHADEVRCLAFSPDGAKLASAGADRVIHVWDVATGNLLAGPNPTGRHGLAVIPAGDRLLLASTGGPTFRVWDTTTGDEVRLSSGDASASRGSAARDADASPLDGPAYAVAATADGRYLAAGGTDYFTRLYDRTTGESKRLEATKPPIGSVAFSTDGAYLLHTSPADGLVWVWNPATGEPVIILIEAADGCTLEGLAALPGGRVAVGGIDYLSTGERTGAVCVWDVAAKHKTREYDFGVYALAADPAGKYLAGAGIADVVHVWDLESDESVFELPGHQERINAVAFSPDGSYLLSGGDDQTVRVWDVLSGRLLAAREFDSPVQGLAFSPDGRWLFTANGNTTCHQIEFKRLLEE